MKTLKLRDELPDDLIVKILSYLPAICLIKCTTVCKSWYSLIKSANFSFTHLTVSRNHNPPLLIAFCATGEFSLYIDDKGFTKYMNLLSPSITDLLQIKVLGSCNGIVCLSYLFGGKFILWNPSIRKELMLPPPIIYQREALVGFGFDSSSNSYKVFRMPYGSSSSGKAELYSSKSESWKEVREIAPTFNIERCQIGAFVNGSLHWVVDRGHDRVFQNVVMAFDLKDETFHEIMLPDCLIHVSASLLEVKVYPNSSIAIVKSCGDYDYDYDYSEIWIMKEYGVVNSWEKLDVGKNGFVLGFVNNGQQVLMNSLAQHPISFYFFREPVKNVIHNTKHWFGFFHHVESLLLLDEGNDAATEADPKLSTKISEVP